MGRALRAERWRTVRVDGADVEYLDVGEGDPLLFLHGWGMTPRVYLPSVRRLCRAGVRVIAPSLPGFGGSDALPLRDATIPAYADRMAAFADAIDLEQPVFLMGHSFGGGVAIRLATVRPDLVRSLTLLNSVGGSPARPAFVRRSPDLGAMTSEPWWRWALAVVAEADPRTLLHADPRTIAAAGWGVARDLVPNVVRRPFTLTRTALVALGADLAEEAHALVESGMPVLFVWGDRDRLITPGAFAEIAGQVPPEIVQGRHGWLLTAPAEFAQLLHNALVVHAMLERSRRGLSASARPVDDAVAGYLPRERRHRARHATPRPDAAGQPWLG